MICGFILINGLIIRKFILETGKERIIFMDGQNMNTQQGAPVQQPYTQQPYPQQPYAQQSYPQYAAPADNEMSIGAWVGALIVSCIPVVGLICLIVWAVSSDPYRVARKRWAIAQLILMAIIIVLSIVFSSVLAAAFSSMF